MPTSMPREPPKKRVSCQVTETEPMWKTGSQTSVSRGKQLELLQSWLHHSITPLAMKNKLVLLKSQVEVFCHDGQSQYDLLCRAYL